MWTQVQKMLNPTAAEKAGSSASVPIIPLRKSATALEALDIDKVIRFSRQCPLPPLTSSAATVIGSREYRFGEDVVKSYQLKVGDANHYFLTIAEDEQGQYLGVSRMLDATEQDIWFGRDALGFFTELSSAKSIRCKADLMVEGEWAAARYSKTVDWVEGTVAPTKSPRLAKHFHYNLLVNEAGDKALEIEHEDTSGENRIYVTVYRPIEDIAGIDDARGEPHEEMPTHIEQPLFKPEPTLTSMPPAQMPKQRQDFRRLQDSAQQIHIARTPTTSVQEETAAAELPSFLLTREDYSLTLDQMIQPGSEQVRVGVHAARALIDYAVDKKVRVRDVLRNMLGLKSALSEEVIFEMPLTNEDYRTLAMRYKLRPDHHVEIRARLEEELRQKLTDIA